MVTIRLSRVGTKKKPFYHVVVTDSRNKRDGRLIERLGFYNPMATGQDIPMKLAEWIAGVALKNKILPIIYLLIIFYGVPLIIIILGS